MFLDFMYAFSTPPFCFTFVLCYAVTPFCNSINLMAFVSVFQCNPSYELMLRCTAVNYCK